MRTLDQYLDAGAARVAVHVEAEPHLHRFAQHVRSKGVSPGLAINPGTSLALLDEALHFLDFVLVMSVNPGWGGQPFIEGSLERIAQLVRNSAAAGRRVEIAVDGGVSEENARALCEAGARHLVAGSAVFGKGDVDAAIRSLRSAALQPVAGNV
jgi:ribulose-phosphate 3-epimerase